MRRFAAFAPIALIAAMAVPAFAGSITIEGVGEVTAIPDTAAITSGVTTQGATAREALDLNTKAMADLIAALKDAGIAARDVQTSGFSVTPNYVYSDERDENGYNLPAKVTGYQVSNTVSVVVRKLADLGTILDRSVTVGANTVNGVSFSVADPSELLNKARKAAFADARSKAELYAEVAGSKLENIASISESQGYNAGPSPMYARADISAAPVPVEAGELTFSINVTVEWDLADTK